MVLQGQGGPRVWRENIGTKVVNLRFVQFSKLAMVSKSLSYRPGRNESPARVLHFFSFLATNTHDWPDEHANE